MNNRRGNTLIIVLLASVIVALIGFMIPALIKSSSEKTYASYLKHEINKLETRMRVKLSSKDSWSISGGVHLKASVQAELIGMANNYALIDPDCPDANPCGFFIKDTDGDGTPNIDAQALAGSTNGAITFTLGFNGRKVRAFERLVQVEMPSITGLGSTSPDQCPADRPILVGLASDGSVICKDIGYVFMNGIPNTQKCASPMVNGCYADSGRCPAGYFAKVADFKVQCYRLPKVTCPADQVIKSMDLGASGVASVSCGERPDLSTVIAH